MAYNHDKNINIVDSQNWAIQKTLTDEKVKKTYLLILIKFQ